MLDFPRLQLVAPPWALQGLTHLWQSTVVALGILLLLAVGHRLTARTRRTLGWIALAKFAVPAAWLASLAGYFAPAPRQWLSSDALSLPIRLANGGTVEGGRAVAWIAPVWIVPVLTWLWFAGAIVLLAWWGVRAARARRQLMRGARPSGGAVQNEVRLAAERVGLRPVPRCVLVDARLSPGAVGILSPVLVLPAGLAEKLPRAELAAILIHECVHLRRRDNLWNAVRSLFAALLWFNPIVWLVNRAISLETEKSCDERVLAITGDAEAYASSIVASVRHTLGVVPAGLSAVTTPPVLARVKAILEHGGRRDRPIMRWAYLTSALALIAVSGRTGSIAADAPAPRAAAPSAADAAAKLPPLAATAANPATPKPAPNPPATGIVFDGIRKLDSSESLRERLASADPEERMRVLQEELNRARQIAEEANAELKRMRDERAAVVAKQKEIADAEAKAAAAANPRPVEPPPAPRIVRNELLPPASSSAPSVPDIANLPSGMYKGMRIFEVDALEQKPVVKFQARPRYPFEMRRNGIGGEVVVDFVVDTEGNVVNARAVRSTREEFEAAAVEAVSKWRYRPGRKGSRDVPVQLQVPIVFKVE